MTDLVIGTDMVEEISASLEAVGVFVCGAEACEGRLHPPVRRSLRPPLTRPRRRR